MIRAGSVVKYLVAAAALCATASTARAADETVLTQMPAGYIVVPFENHSPVKNLDWQASALAVTVAEKLESHPALRPAYGPAILDGLDYAFDPEKVARRAHDAGARWVFAGGFARPNWKAQVAVRLYTVVEPSNILGSRNDRFIIPCADNFGTGAFGSRGANAAASEGRGIVQQDP